MFSFIVNILPCLLLGLVIGSLLTVLFVFLATVLTSRSGMTPLKGIIILGLFVFYVIQSSLMMGAQYAGDYVDDITTSLTGLTDMVCDDAQRLGQEDVMALRQNIEENYPQLIPFVEKIDFASLSNGSKDLTTQISLNIKTAINQYFWRRVMWIAGVSVLFLILYVLSSPSGSRGRRSRLSARTRRVPASRRDRISRRR